MVHMVHCLMSPRRYAGILSAYGLAHMVHCLMSPCMYPVSLWHGTHGSLSYVSMQVCRYPVSLWHGTHGSLSYVSMQVCWYLVSLWHCTHGSLSCFHVGMQVSCQFMAWHTWFIVLCLHAGMHVSCQLTTWHSWFTVLSPWFVSMQVCWYPISLWHGTHGSLSCLLAGIQVHCLMSHCMFAGILSAYGLAHMVHCLMSPCRYAGILSAYGMALADVVHEAQEPCALIYRSGRYCSLQHIASFFCFFFLLFLWISMRWVFGIKRCVWWGWVGGGVMYINVLLLLFLLISMIRYLSDFEGRAGIKHVACE